MPTPAQIVGEQGVESGFAATHGVLDEVSRLVALRYDLPETFNGLLQQLRVLHLDLLTPGTPRRAESHDANALFAASDVVPAEILVELPCISLGKGSENLPWRRTCQPNHS